MGLHVVIFPFMSKGHTIPLLHLARLLLRRGLSVTIFTTPMNSPFIRQSLLDTETSVVEIPFPQNIPHLPTGIESMDKLPSMSLFVPFVRATKLMLPDFEKALHSIPTVNFIISDGFLWWTQESASKLGIPRYFFYGMNNFALVVSRVVGQTRPHANVNSDDEPFSVPDFPRIKLTKNDFEIPPDYNEQKGTHSEFMIEQRIQNMQSKGYIVNSFYELEPEFVDYFDSKFKVKLKAWCLGPLCLAEPLKTPADEKPMWLQWLDEKLAHGRSVLYVAFGTQAKISGEQLEEIAVGLERAEVDFLWVVRSIGLEKLEGFRERVKDRGLIVSEWVDQVEILNHECVNGFMSHCGWNSVMESICASVPILAFPMIAEQHLNARMVVEELGVGDRVMALNGSVRGFVGAECIKKMVKGLMEGEKGKEVRKKVKETGEMARAAMEEGGSSWRSLDLLLIEEISGK